MAAKAQESASVAATAVSKSLGPVPGPKSEEIGKQIYVLGIFFIYEICPMRSKAADPPPRL